MADNVAITAGAGTTISTEEVTTLNGAGSQPAQHVQRMLLALVSGAAATDISSSNPLPVSDAGGSLTVDDGGGSLTVDGVVGLVPQTAGGWSVSRLLAAGSTNATSVKRAAGQIGGWYLYNAATSTRYLKLYDKASAPTVGTDTPFMTIPIPAGSAANVEFTQGIAMGTGIAFALTTGVADADTGALTANDVVVNLFYK